MSNNPLPNKERVKLPRQRMPEQDAQVRACNFLEVNTRVRSTADQAHQESIRCIECNKPGCVTKCPVSVDVRAVMDFIVKGDYLGAASKVREDNALPAITGRVCPVEDQCESGCVLGKKGEPVGIAYLERFVADWERSSGQFGLPKSKAATGKKVAIVGSGPAGLACAGDLIQMGHQVHVFEALHELGGVLVYGIPEFRLPKDIVAFEIETLRKRGVAFRDQRGRGQDGHHRRAHAGRRLRLGVYRDRRRIAALPQRTGRALQRHLLRQRVPDPCKSHAGLSLPRIR